ncbi:PQQ-binding-like beta-propeller repeat protein, partial [Candidatus Poribacteria bacterium]|nr:PQQ-binding-like beta-propeller repeat protein [Candidatus Poribacteria bacterium]
MDRVKNISVPCAVFFLSFVCIAAFSGCQTLPSAKASPSVEKQDSNIFLERIRTLNFASHATGSVFADINNDGILDLVVSGSEDSRGRKNSLTMVKGPDLLGNQIQHEYSKDAINTIPAVADRNKNDDIEIYYANDIGEIRGVRADLYSWPVHTVNPNCKIHSSHTIADFTEDGYPELTLGTNNGQLLVYDLYSKKLLWVETVGGSINTSPAIGDVDKDNDIDIVVGNEDGKVYAFEGSNRSVLWTFNTRAEIRSDVAIGDIDSDNQQEIVVGNNNGYMFCIDGITGKEEWSAHKYSGFGKEIISPITLADVDNDGLTEILAGTQAGRLLIYSSHGELMLDKDLGGRIPGSILVADVNSDGIMEILAVSVQEGKSMIYILNGKAGKIGQILYQWPLVGEIKSHPALADVDKDCRMELSIGPHILRFKGGGEIRWGQFGGDAFNTSFLDNALKYGVDPVEYVKNPDSVAYVPVKKLEKIWKKDNVLAGSVNFADVDNDSNLDI